jgi:hypothetical protein
VTSSFPASSTTVPLTPRWWLNLLELSSWAPRNLVQPILPGWFDPTIVINEANSSAPLTETAIVEAHSYGRQLGKISDAVEALIENAKLVADDDQRISDFEKMEKEIRDIKKRASQASARRILADLASLKDSDEEEYRALIRDLLTPYLD